MKIIVPRETVGRLLGMLILSLVIAAVSYLAVAWVWWQPDPGQWSFAARASALTLAVILMTIRGVQVGFPGEE